MPISCHFRDRKALLVTSPTHVSSAITSVQTLSVFAVFILEENDSKCYFHVILGTGRILVKKQSTTSRTTVYLRVLRNYSTFGHILIVNKKLSCRRKAARLGLSVVETFRCSL